MRRLAKAYASLVCATAGLLVVRPLAEAAGLRHLREIAPELLDGASAIAHVNKSIAETV